MKKTRFLSLALCLALCLALLPAPALAADSKVEQVYDVYQGDGFYITAKPYTLKSTRYTMGNSHNYNFDGRFHDGMIAVWTANVDENYVNRQFVQEYNFADKDGNILFPEGLFHGDYYIYNKHEGDMAPSDGMIPFWDGETKGGSNDHPLLGFVDYSGREVIGCQYLDDTITPFRDGLSNVFPASVSVGSLREGEGFIDKSGNLVISADDIRGIYVDHDASFSDGLVPCNTYRFGDDVTYGYMDTSGNWALKLLSYNYSDLSDYDNDYWKLCAGGKTDGYLMPFVSVFNEGYFSDGYAVCYDLRSGNELDYNFAIIDKSGHVVGTFSDAEPYGSGFHDGLLRVRFIDNRGNGAGRGFVNTKGEVVIRESDCANPTVGWNAGGNTNKGYSCGLLVVRERIVADTKGNTVIPEGAFESMRPFDSDIAIGFLSPECGGAIDWGMGILSTPYILEKHQGTYTGSGRVYNAAKGGAVTVPTQPEQPSGSTPSSWAVEPVNAAVAAGIVPEALQSRYNQATTRAEFCALAVELYETVTGSEITERATFTDTSDPNVEKMAALKVVNGEEEGVFNPNGRLTRQQAAAMLSRLADALGKPLPAKETTFADKASFSPYAVGPIGQMQATEVMKGVGDNKFDPNGVYTREQSIVTMMRLFDIVK